MTSRPAPFKHLRRLLIANRGEIAVRIIRSCKEYGVTSVAIYSEADRSAAHASLADEALALEGSSGQAYLDAAQILRLCAETHIDGVIPGYGFLSERTDFAKAVVDAGMAWLGPDAATIEAFGLKHRARELAVAAKVPVVPGTGLLSSAEDALKAAEEIGFPVMLKATGGGGGMGLQICRSRDEVTAAYENVTSRGKALFSNAGVFLEKYFDASRHIEVQVFGNGSGAVVHFGERECSIQRRHQKVIEEAPSPFVIAHPELRKKLTDCAVALLSSVSYKSAGTVEYLVDDRTGSFFFLEVNTRLQVEHPITEETYGVDLVALMLRQGEAELASPGGGIPAEELLSLQRDGPTGAAIEVRVYAENPARDFAPSAGLLQCVHWAEAPGVRVDGWVETGTQVSAFYDPMLAKVIVSAPSRDAAIEKMVDTLSRSKVYGPPNNMDYTQRILESDEFKSGNTLTSFLKSFKYQPCAVDVISGGAYTTVQDFPGRNKVGMGVPESGPMDSLSFRVANLLVGNPEGTEGLEVTLSGPELLFLAPAVVALAGAPTAATLDGEPFPFWARRIVRAGQRLVIGAVSGDGCRAYLAIRGGFPKVAEYLGSKSTTPSLALGGYQGRTLVAGDSLELCPKAAAYTQDTAEYDLPQAARLDSLLKSEWEIYVMAGPHDDDYFLTPKDRDLVYGSTWKLSHNSNRVGYRLDGPRLEWARDDGGEGGSHPANVIDFGYPTGGLNWNGDVPVLFAADCPSLGGLLITSTLASADAWRVGQAKPGDSLRMRRISFAQAVELQRRMGAYLEMVAQLASGEASADSARSLDMSLPAGERAHEAVLATLPPMESSYRPLITYRQAGDRYLIVEYGTMSLDVLNRCRLEMLCRELRRLENSAILSLNPNARSLTIQFDPLVIEQRALIDLLVKLEESMPPISDVKIPSRKIRLPIVFNDPLVKDSVQRYMETIRDKASYLPDNLDAMARSNGLPNGRAAAEAAIGLHLVVAVGFLCATPIGLPLDPRSRMNVQKYNPTRVFTPRGTVGLGGQLLAIYPVDAPGGYQYWGRTLPIWDTFGKKPNFSPSTPWLTQAFDVIDFYEVSQEEYDRDLAAFDSGAYTFDIREDQFDPAAYASFLESIKEEADAFRARQLAAGKEDRALEVKLYAEWEAERKAAEEVGTVKISFDDPSLSKLQSPMSSNVWKVMVEPGHVIEEGQRLAILEAMKMEVPLDAPADLVGLTVEAIVSKPGTVVNPGDVILVAKKA